MLSTAAFSMLFALGAHDVTAATIGNLPSLTIAGAPVRAAPHVEGRLALRSELLDASDHSRPRRNSAVLAQSAAPASASPEPSAAPAAEASAAPDSTAPAEEEPDIELLRQRARITRVHRALGFASLGSLAATEVLGTILAINYPTVFGTGACAASSGTNNTCVLGSFGQSGLIEAHEVSAFITVGFYTATGIFALSMPDPEHVSAGNDARGNRIRIHKALALVHMVGMILEPILGAIAIDPALVGIDVSNPHNGQLVQDFQSDMRTIHLGVGYVTLAALTSAMIVELLQ